MAGFDYDSLVDDIRLYTEVASNVLTGAVCNRFRKNCPECLTAVGFK